MRSLHSRLLAWLIIPLLFMSGAHLLNTYLDTRKTVEGIFDKLLVTLALSISEHALSSGGDLLTDELLELIRITTNDNLYYKVIGPGGAFITGYEDIPEPVGGIQISGSNLLFYDAAYLDKKVRVIALSSLIDRPEYSGWMTTFVAQTKNERDSYVASVLFQNLWRVAFMIVIASLLLSLGVSLGLKPLRKIQSSVRSRTSQDLSPIQYQKLPAEISGLVEELNDLLARLSAYISFTKRFVENAAHQLRTPVTALLPQSELALRKAETERDKIAIGKIKDSAENIAHLTHQLLNLTHAESISLSKHGFAFFDLAALARQRVKSYNELYPQLLLSLDLKEARVFGVELFVGEIIDNLLDNARKYGQRDDTAEQTAKIRVRTFVHQGQSILEVMDSGNGIPEEQQAAATERFVRLSESGVGSGLGLAIVQEIVEAHGATMNFRKLAGSFSVSCCFPSVTDDKHQHLDRC